MNIIGLVIESCAAMYVVICVSFTWDFTGLVPFAVADTRRVTRDSANVDWGLRKKSE